MKDLTKGYPAKVIILFAIPLMIGSVFQQLYNITDSKIVSTYINSNALAAVGATAVVSNTLMGFVNGLTQGFGIMVARSYGEQNYKSLKNYVAGAVKLTAGVVLVLSILSQIMIRNILILLNTPEDILTDAVDYVKIILLGFVFISAYNLSANILRSVGDSRKPLYCLILSVVINVGLDLLFVVRFGMGIKGAAWATIISQCISSIACVGILVVKYKTILPTGSEWKVSRQQYNNLIPVGLSMGLMGCIVNIGTITLQSAINGLGTQYVTAHTSGRRVFDIMMIMIFTIGMSMTTFVSQNLGAGKLKRIRQGIRHAVIMDTAITCVLILFAYTLGDNIVRWVASTDDEVILTNGVMYIQVGVWFFFVLGPLFILRCSLQGLGRKIIPLVSSCLELTVKILSAFILVPMIGYLGVALTEPISWIVMIIPLIIVYVSMIPKLK